MPSKLGTGAEVFRKLHSGPALLILPNAWDAGSARLIEAAGASAIATTSAGVAWSHGYPDGDALPVSLLSTTVAEISRVIKVPLTVDIEGGYANEPALVAQTVVAVIDAGAVGINIEDGSGEPELLQRKIEQAKEAASRLTVDLFVNARTDVYLRNLTTPEGAIEETLKRARGYAEAGADSIFVPGVVDRTAIQNLARSSPLPLNVLALPGLPPARELEALGVRRLSAGSGITQALWARARTLTEAFLANGNSDALYQEGRPYAEINALAATGN